MLYIRGTCRPTVYIAENLAATAGLTRYPYGMHLDVTSSYFAPWALHSLSIYFSRRVPVCPHFAYNQVASSPAPVSQSVGITVSRYSRVWSVYRMSIIGRRRFYPSELRPSIIRRDERREMEEGRAKKVTRERRRRRETDTARIVGICRGWWRITRADGRTGEDMARGNR